MNLTDRIYIISLAFVLDLLLGDPHWMPHPVRWIGKAVHYLEGIFRKTGLPLKVSGILLAIVITGITWGISYWANHFAYKIYHYFGFTVSVILMYTTLSMRSLYDESMKVFKDLKRNDLMDARQNLSMIVGRDTESLDGRGVIRGAVETIAENTADGVIAPLLYAFIGGPSLAMAYKAINTLDSMVGYKNEQYIDLGWAPARLDDIANYVPARISAFLIPVAALLCGRDWRNSFMVVMRDRHKHPSPNSGIPEAAVAGALGLQLGGLNYYHGIPSPRPFIGERSRDFSIEDIRKANKIMVVSSVLMALSGVMILYTLFILT